jgi:hypothetical protein
VSRLSLGAFGVFKSNADGVLGVFAVEPKDANAPEPRLKADEALAEGEETFVESGEMALKGLERPCELSGPNRFDEWLRGDSAFPLSLLSTPDMDNESLLELIPVISDNIPSSTR